MRSVELFVSVGTFLAIEAAVVLMVATPMLLVRSGAISRKFIPLLWVLVPVNLALGTVIALAVATAPE